MDVWSLYATIVDAHSGFTALASIKNYADALNLLQAKAATSLPLKPMARLYPERRASAAQILVHNFDGKGLTTARSKVTPIRSDTDIIPQENLARRARRTRGNLVVLPRTRPLPLK